MKKLLLATALLLAVPASAFAGGVGAHGGQGGGIAMFGPGEINSVGGGWTCVNPLQKEVRIELDRGGRFIATDDDGHRSPLECTRGHRRVSTGY
jgi:hypothetical protein